jgi:hypothetical protein
MTNLPKRDPLKALQLDCPNHDITIEHVHGEVFYVALANPDSDVTPRTAMAQSVERLRQKLTGEREFIGSDRPSIARVYDYLLGGKDNLAVDRFQAERLLDAAPHAKQIALEGRALHTRIVERMAMSDIMDFVDLGCGLPTHPATHETAQAIRPNSKVVYVDNDPMVLAHARALLAKETQGVTVFGGDVLYPREILYDPAVREALDFGRPVGVLLSFMLHFFDSATSRKIVAQVANCLPVGSYLSVSVVHGTTGEASRKAVNAYTTAKAYSHGFSDLMDIMEDLDFLEEWNPGIIDARYWPDRTVAIGGEPPEREVDILVGMGRKVTELKP